jgi:anti-sigma factor RsiW
LIGRVSCRDLIDFLDDYVAGALPAAQRALFEDHLEGCVGCERYLRSYQGTMRAVALAYAPTASPPPEVPDELVGAILAAWRASAD